MTKLNEGGTTALLPPPLPDAGTAYPPASHVEILRPNRSQLKKYFFALASRPRGRRLLQKRVRVQRPQKLPKNRFILLHILL